MTDNNIALKKAAIKVGLKVTLQKAHLKVTLPRCKILEVLHDPEYQHASPEDLYKKLQEGGENVGLATVYRVLKQFEDTGIVIRRNFEGHKSVFELTQQHHHDHLICLDCGKVTEFSDQSIESRQQHIAEQHNINLTNRSLCLYGHCNNNDCRKNNLPHNKS